MIKSVPFIYLSLLSIFFHSGPSLAQTLYAVKWVSDGDTIILKDGRHVRYIGINAPEVKHADRKAEAYGYQAKNFNAKLVYSRRVRLEFDKEKYDHFGRLLAYVFLEDDTFVNQAILEHGWAYCLPRRPNDRYESVFLNSQRYAMLKKLGLWGQFNEKRGSYIANRRSKRFHQETCPFGKKTKERNRIIFKAKWEAFWAGFAPCKKCLGNYDLQPRKNPP
jgi:micrococcal nuclease